MDSIPTFISFCDFIVKQCIDKNIEYDPDALLDVFVNFIEPFANTHNIQIPEDLVDILEGICGSTTTTDSLSEIYSEDSDM